MKGRVKKVDKQRGFGFIVPEEGERDFFFHSTGVSGNFNEINEGDTVNFEKEETPRGPKAVNVRKIEAAQEMSGTEMDAAP